MHADERPQRPPPKGPEQAIVRELWLVRDSDLSDQDNELLATRDQTASATRRSFDWIGADTPPQHDSPAEIAAFHQRLRDLAIRRAETYAEQEQEDLRASREANRLTEDEREQDTRHRSRTNNVRLVRSIVLLIALIWAVTLLILTSTGVPVTELDPSTELHDAITLLRNAETAIGKTRHAPVRPVAGASACRSGWDSIPTMCAIVSSDAHSQLA